MAFKERWKQFDTTDKISFVGTQVGLSIIIIWIIGKLAGWIHSPAWVEVIPAIGTVIAIFMFCMTLYKGGKSDGKVEQKLDFLMEGLKKLENNMDRGFVQVREELKEVRKNIHQLDKRVKLIEFRIS